MVKNILILALFLALIYSCCSETTIAKIKDTLWDIGGDVKVKMVR